MGYYISSQDTDTITITPDQFPAMVDALRAAETKAGSHLSWCRTIDEYWDSFADADLTVRQARTIRAVFTDFGFALDTPDADDQPIHIEYWDGDKMGWAWDEIWTAIGAVATTPATWIIRGEDGEVWAERVGHGNGHTTHAVQLVVID